MSETYAAFVDVQNKTMLKPDFDPLSDVEIINFAPIRVAALRHWDHPAHIGNSICRLIDWCQRNHLPPHKNTTFTIVHAPPTTPAKDRSDH